MARLLFSTCLTIMVCLIVALVHAAELTWDDGEPADHNWSSPTNWNPNVAPTALDIVHFDDTAVGTNVVDTDITVAGLTYDNSAGRFETTINDQVILVVSNYLRVGSSIPATTKVRISGPGGTLRMQGDIQVSGTNTGSLVIE